MKKGQRMLLTQTQKGAESAPLASVSKGVICFFKLVITINPNNVSRL